MIDIGGAAAAAATERPGSGCATGLGREAAFGFYSYNKYKIRSVTIEHTSDGPPARKSFPCVMGRTTPGFLFAGGRERLLAGSPEGTCTV